MSGYLLDMCTIMAFVIRRETYEKVRQVENTSVGTATANSSSTTDKIQAELASAVKLLEGIESSIADFTQLKTPQSDMRDQRVIECVASWDFTHTSYINCSTMAMELESCATERKSTKASK